MDGCVALHPKDEWERMTGAVDALPFTAEPARKLRRLLYGSAYEAKLDRQGRFVLPQKLRDYAALESEVIVVGARDHLEFWSPQKWSSYSEQMDRPEVLAEHLEGLGI